MCGSADLLVMKAKCTRLLYYANTTNSVNIYELEPASGATVKPSTDDYKAEFNFRSKIRVTTSTYLYMFLITVVNRIVDIRYSAVHSELSNVIVT